MTALSIAVIEGWQTMTDILIGIGADPSVVDGDGLTLLHSAVYG